MEVEVAPGNVMFVDSNYPDVERWTYLAKPDDDDWDDYDWGGKDDNDWGGWDAGDTNWNTDW